MPATDERVRLRLGTAFIEHAADLWPQGVPAAATPEWIRANVDDILGMLERMLRNDGRDVRRVPHRLHWLLWLLDDLDSTGRNSMRERP